MHIFPYVLIVGSGIYSLVLAATGLSNAYFSLALAAIALIGPGLHFRWVVRLVWRRGSLHRFSVVWCKARWLTRRQLKSFGRLLKRNWEHILLHALVLLGLLVGFGGGFIVLAILAGMMVCNGMGLAILKGLWDTLGFTFAFALAATLLYGAAGEGFVAGFEGTWEGLPLTLLLAGIVLQVAAGVRLRWCSPASA